MQVEPSTVPGLPPLLTFFYRLIGEFESVVERDGIFATGILRFKLLKAAQDLAFQAVQKLLDLGPVDLLLDF